MPEPRAYRMTLYAAHRKKPMLSSAIDMTIVHKMVTTAPLTMPNTSPISRGLTMPIKSRASAPPAAGYASFIPFGLQMSRVIVAANIAYAPNVWTSCMIVCLARDGEFQSLRPERGGGRFGSEFRWQLHQRVQRYAGQDQDESRDHVDSPLIGPAGGPARFDAESATRQSGGPGVTSGDRR